MVDLGKLKNLYTWLDLVLLLGSIVRSNKIDDAEAWNIFIALSTGHISELTEHEHDVYLAILPCTFKIKKVM